MATVPAVYLETTIIGYLTSRISRDLVTAANQQLTRQWWEEHKNEFELFISQFVVEECAAGDETAARERIEFIEDLPTIEVTDDVRDLAKELMKKVPLPERAEVDALQVAVAAAHGIDYLLTWNCKHIANATLRHPIEAVCRDYGFEPPTICTPQELLEA